MKHRPTKRGRDTCTADHIPVSPRTSPPRNDDGSD
jgi:hypothetical protein